MYRKSHVLLLCLVGSMLVSGCSAVFKSEPLKNSIFDPTPYKPASTTSFANFDGAQRGLAELANEYGEQRNALMRDQLLLDVPLFGLAAATIASGIYGASSDLTLGLGLGSATVGGAKLYFNSPARVKSYNKGSAALHCGASVAGTMSILEQSLGDRGTTLEKSLGNLLDLADQALGLKLGKSAGSMSTSQRADLDKARTAARKAYENLSGALSTIETGHKQLGFFANTVIEATTTRIVGDVQDLDAVLKIIQAVPTTTEPKKTEDASETMSAQNLRLSGDLIDVAGLTKKLEEQTIQAEKIAKDTKDTWNELDKCALAQVQ